MTGSDIDLDDERPYDDDPVAAALSDRGPKSSRGWLRLIEDAEGVFTTWQARSDGIDKLYANLEALANVGRDRQFQLFWANIGVLAPAIYARAPVPVVIPRFKDRRPLPRQASELLERASIVNAELEDLHDVLKAVRDDLSINSRGVIWVRYEASGKGKEFRERAVAEHVDRKDWLCDQARKWKEVDWVAKRSWLTRGEMRKRFRKTSGDAYKDAEYSRRHDDKEIDDGRKKAGVWELWSKSKNVVVWLAPGVDVLLDEGEPHLTLDGFFPCPRPAYGTLQRRTLIPVPDFMLYKDQIEEINEITGRIAALTGALQVRGFYPAGAGDVADAIETAVKSVSDNQVLVPIANWNALGQGGVKDMIVWLPIDMVANTITQLISLRKQLIDDVYQISGISDIMRGQTQASETLGAQQLKSQYGSIRISDRKDEMVRIARDTIALLAEIMAENFSTKTFLEMTQLDAPNDAKIAEQAKPLQAQLQQMQRELQQAQTDPETRQLAQQNPQAAQQIMAQAQQKAAGLQAQLAKLSEVPTIEKIMALLREHKLRPYVLDIETNSTIEPDEQAQKAAATEFVTAVGGAIKQGLPLVQAMPQSAAMVAETLKFLASQYRAGRQLEQVIDEFADQMAQMASQPKPPDPKQAKQDARAQVDGQRLQLDQQRFQAEQAGAAQDRQIKAQEAQAAAEGRRAEQEAKVALTNKQIELMDSKGSLELAALRVGLAKMQAEARAVGAVGVDEVAAAAIVAPQEAMVRDLQARIDKLAQLIAAPNQIVRDQAGRIMGSRKQLQGV